MEKNISIRTVHVRVYNIRAKAAEAAEAAAEAAETQDKEEYGDIRIADEVICIVASLAAVV